MRGCRPTVTIGRAKKFAERQGYRWVPNPDKDMPFDAIAYRGNDLFVVRVRTSRNAPGEYDLSEDFFRDDYRILRTLPFPAYIFREVWVRFTWSRTFRRYRLVGKDLWETTMIDQDGPVFPCLDPAADPAGGSGGSGQT
ncbi:MAG TPA: hypothetical protein VEI81_01530 [Methanoregula sp.]|nr:hypothetical protein [Methanoregula sp.]